MANLRVDGFTGAEGGLCNGRDSLIEVLQSARSTVIVPIAKIQVRRDEDGVWIAK